MCQEYYAEIINEIEKNILIKDLLDKILNEISIEIINYLNNNITTFHHTISERITFEQANNKVSFHICEHIYTIDINNVLKEYNAIVCLKTIYLSENAMKICVLKELLHSVKGSIL